MTFVKSPKTISITSRLLFLPTFIFNNLRYTCLIESTYLFFSYVVTAGDSVKSSKSCKYFFSFINSFFFSCNNSIFFISLANLIYELNVRFLFELLQCLLNLLYIFFFWGNWLMEKLIFRVQCSDSFHVSFYCILLLNLFCFQFFIFIRFFYLIFHLACQLILYLVWDCMFFLLVFH